jgi:hypothetical protein
MVIQFVILVFIVFVLGRIVSRWRAQQITGREVAVWTVFWVGVAAAVIFPRFTDVIAAAVGVSRGADLLVYLSVIGLFFVAFKIIVRLDQLERDLTKLVRGLALRDDDKK